MNAQIKSLTGSQFFAAARGIAVRLGAHRCFFCGGPTDDHTPKEQAIRKTFTAFDRVAQGDYVCDGCIATFDEKAVITLIDGTTREGQKIRNYSWVVTPTQALAATKAHREQLREFLLNPPRDKPFLVSITDSGQVHCLYRTRPTIYRNAGLIYLDGETIAYTTERLRELLNLSAELISVFGKTALMQPTARAQLMSKLNNVDDPSQIDELWERWQRISGCEDARLSLWLS